MALSARASYTAKFIDGPLEGKTMRVNFQETGDPQSRLEIPVDSDSESDNKRYLYARGTGVEFAGDDPSSEQPSAVDYRYLQTLLE